MWPWMRVALVMGVLLAVAPASVGAAHSASEQVVFATGASPKAPLPEGTGTFTFGGGTESSTFGFWIWCEAESSNSRADTCDGSIYFYAFYPGLPPKAISGAISEPSPRLYVMPVQSADGAVNPCTLTNVTAPSRGPSTA